MQSAAVSRAGFKSAVAIRRTTCASGPIRPGERGGRQPFASCDRGGKRAAIISTPIQTARPNDVDPQAWLADLSARIADHRISDRATRLTSGPSISTNRVVNDVAAAASIHRRHGIVPRTSSVGTLQKMKL
jgi:hypothetical protein